MADKKITALTALTATGKDSAADLLHIIDYSASPVNKKISVANLFSNVNTDTHIYGSSKVFEVGQAAAVNSHIRVAIGADATTDGAVTINDDGVAYCDFLVKSLNSDSALSIDAGADTVTINGDSANLDFIVNGDTVASMIRVDASADAVGIGLAAPATAYMLDVGEVGSGATGKSIQAAGGADIGGNSTITGSLGVTGDTTLTGAASVTGLFKITQAAGTTLVGTADGSGTGGIPVTTLVSYLSTGVGAAANDEFILPDGVTGQMKILILTTIANSATAKIGITSFDFTGSNDCLQLNTVGESVTLIFHTAKWYVIGHHGMVEAVAG